MHNVASYQARETSYVSRILLGGDWQTSCLPSFYGCPKPSRPGENANQEAFTLTSINIGWKFSQPACCVDKLHGSVKLLEQNAAYN